MTLSIPLVIEDNEDLPPFKASEWIGMNKAYSNVPEQVSLAKNKCMQLPDSQKKRCDNQSFSYFFTDL